MSKFLTSLTAIALLSLATNVFAQRPRTISSQDSTESANTMPVESIPQPAKAKYEGGVFGHPKKLDGTLSFDDTNQRLLFGTDKEKEVLSIPYASITGAFGDTHAVQPAAATVASHIPYVGLP